MSKPDTWIAAFKWTQASMAKENGVSPTGIPRVKNQEAASILRVTMHNAQRLKLSPSVTERWYEVALALAGWRQPGDKFLVTAQHRNALLSDAATVVLWQLALSVANTAQMRGDTFVAPTMNPAADYDVVLRQAWSKMLAERNASAPSAPIVNPLPSPASPATMPDTDDDTDGDGSGLLVLLLLFAVGSGKV